MRKADEKRRKANRQREASRTQVQRNLKLDPGVSEQLDSLRSDTGLSLNDLIDEALAMSAAALRKKYAGRGG
jgi:predicted HicB family RNase H-like nuclease